MDKHTEPSSVQWCCTDCLMYMANGEFDPDWSQAQIDEFLARIQDNQGDSLVTLGMLREEHSCNIPSITASLLRDQFIFLDRENCGRRPFPHLFHRFFVVCDSGFIKGFWRESKAQEWIDAGNVGPTMFDIGGECECEQLTFTWSACDLCGSNLGGSRHAFTFWFKPDEDDPIQSDPAANYQDGPCGDH